MPSAYVDSLHHLADFQAALSAFGQQGREALCGAALEIRRVQDGLEDQLKLWQVEIRHAEEAVFNAKQELARKRMMRIGDRAPDTTEQEVALAKVQHRLDHAEAKRARTKHWILELPDAIAQYESQANPVNHLLESALPRMLVFLDRKMDILEEYAQVSLPDPARGTKP
jgi:hypothetical protein